MIAVLVLIAAILVITAVAYAWPGHPRQPGPAPGAVNLDVTQELWPVARSAGHPPWDDVPAPLNVPGRGTPAAHTTAGSPPGGVAETPTPAGGSSPPAGERHGPGPDCLPEGDAPGSRPPQEAPGPGALPPDLANWHLAMWHAAAAQAKIRQALAGKDGA